MLLLLFFDSFGIAFLLHSTVLCGCSFFRIVFYICRSNWLLLVGWCRFSYNFQTYKLGMCLWIICVSVFLFVLLNYSCLIIEEFRMLRFGFFFASLSSNIYTLTLTHTTFMVLAYFSFISCITCFESINYKRFFLFFHLSLNLPEDLCFRL